MPSTVVHVGFGLLLAGALYRERFDRRFLVVLVAVAVLTDLDTFAGFLLRGAHRALGHTLLVPFVGTALLLYDTRVRPDSWLTARVGPRGVHAAWIVLLVHVFAYVLLDYAHYDGVNLFYPLFDQFYRLGGELALSSTDGLVQTFVEFATAEESGAAAEGVTLDVGSVGTTQDTHISNPVQPTAETDPQPEQVERTAYIAVGGWQLYFAATGLFVLLARRLQDDRSDA